jgi:peroxiredoxin Q/BCP
MLQAGQPAPPFALQSHEDRTVTLADYAGRYLLLWFYPMANTPGCTIEGKGFRDRIQDFESRSCDVVGISFNDVEANRHFAEKFCFPYPLLCDTERATGLAYGACDDASARTPRRISYLIGPDGVVVKAYDKVDVSSHPQQVLEDLDGAS